MGDTFIQWKIIHYRWNLIEVHILLNTGGITRWCLVVSFVCSCYCLYLCWPEAIQSAMLVGLPTGFPRRSSSRSWMSEICLSNCPFNSVWASYLVFHSFPGVSEFTDTQWCHKKHAYVYIYTTENRAESSSPCPSTPRSLLCSSHMVLLRSHTDSCSISLQTKRHVRSSP